MLTLIMGVLLSLKSREVTALKKQCEDLRETMQMMRYEEANLARMLHTASKTKELVEQPTASVVSEGEVEEHVMEMSPIVEVQEVPTEEETVDAGEVMVDISEVQMVPTSESVEEIVVIFIFFVCPSCLSKSTKLLVTAALRNAYQRRHVFARGSGYFGKVIADLGKIAFNIRKIAHLNLPRIICLPLKIVFYQTLYHIIIIISSVF